MDYSNDFDKRPADQDSPLPENPAPDKPAAPAEETDTPVLSEILAEGLAQTPEDDFHPTRRASRSRKKQKKEPTTKLGKLWRDYGYLVITVAVVFVLFRLIFQLAYVPTGSMETTLPTHSLLFSWRAPYLVSDPVPERGSVVTFWNDELGHLLVKRVIGLPGDTVTFESDGVYINGEKLDEPYLAEGLITKSEKSFTVPDGCLFFLGDNRDGSYDSRRWDEPFIPLEKVQARTLLAVSVGKNNAWTGIHLIA